MNVLSAYFFIHLTSKSLLTGYMSVDLRPVAAVSVRLFSGDTELHVCGPVQISLRVSDPPGLQPSSVIPAWFFNQTTGECMICCTKNVYSYALMLFVLSYNSLKYAPVVST